MAEAKASDAEAQVAALTLMIEKLRRALYGSRSERKERLSICLSLPLTSLRRALPRTNWRPRRLQPGPPR